MGLLVILPALLYHPWLLTAVLCEARFLVVASLEVKLYRPVYGSLACMRSRGGSAVPLNDTLEFTVELPDLIMVSSRPPFAKILAKTTQVPSWLTTVAQSASGS
jgi:hypothetical protein